SREFSRPFRKFRRFPSSKIGPRRCIGLVRSSSKRRPSWAGCIPSRARPTIFGSSSSSLTISAAVRAPAVEAVEADLVPKGLRAFRGRKGHLAGRKAPRGHREPRAVKGHKEVKESAGPVRKGLRAPLEPAARLGHREPRAVKGHKEVRELA